MILNKPLMGKARKSCMELLGTVERKFEKSLNLGKKRQGKRIEHGWRFLAKIVDGQKMLTIFAIQLHRRYATAF